MLNKKLSKFLVAGLAVFMLAACSDIVAKPTDYEDLILGANGDSDSNSFNADLEETGSAMNNVLSTIYDAMHDTSTLSTTTINILNKKIFEIYYGEYSNLDTVVNNYKRDTNNTAEIKAFINEHKAYQELNEDGTRNTSEEAQALEIKRVERSYNRIQNLISKKVVNALSGSDFKNIDGLFSEKLFALNIYKKLHKLDPTGTAYRWEDFIENYKFNAPILLTPNLELFNEDDNVWEDKGIIHISTVTKADGTTTPSTFGYYKEYIYNEILPDIYSHMLSEYYLYTKEYSTLGSKYARKATYISLTPNGKTIYSTKHADLIDYFARNNIKGSSAENADLKILEKAWIGYDIHNANTMAVLDGAGFEKVEEEINLDNFPALIDTDTINEFVNKYDSIISTSGSIKTITYYKGTLFGNIIEDFQEINPKNIAESSKTQENKFSGNNSYSYYEGFVKEINSLLQKTYVIEGWGLKSDGFSGLDTSIKDRLMTINVATDLKVPADVASYSSNYLKAIKYDDLGEDAAHFYLLPEKRLPNDEIPFVFSSGSTKTIVQVEEAASVAKLSKKSTSADKYSAEKAEDVAFEICNLLADNSTTKTNAMEYYLEETEILYHDDKILEYFKENYPNLFEE